jgi:uncharacterized protein YndB with AHSA1/START domain
MAVDQQQVQREQPPIKITTPGEREIRFERIFNAPRDVVWNAFTDPSLISEWWGGGAEVEHMDVRQGGSWKFLGGHMPDGTKFVFEGEYLEVDPPRRLVQTYINGWMNNMKWIEQMEFDELGEQTRFTQTSTFESAEQRDMVLPTVEQGAHFTYSRLDKVLERLVGTQSK